MNRKHICSALFVFLMAAILAFYQNCADNRMGSPANEGVDCADCGRVDPALVSSVAFIKEGQLATTLSMQEGELSQFGVHIQSTTCSVNLLLSNQDRLELFAALSQVSIILRSPPEGMVCPLGLPSDYEVINFSSGTALRLANYCGYHNYSTGEIELSCAAKRVLENHDLGNCATDLNAIWAGCP